MDFSKFDNNALKRQRDELHMVVRKYRDALRFGQGSRMNPTQAKGAEIKIRLINEELNRRHREWPK